MGRLFAATYDRCMGAIEERVFSRRRPALLSRAAGAVLEIGAGTGANLPHYPAGTDPVVTEFDLHMMRQLVAADRRPVQLARASASQLPFRAVAFDTVVLTLVLCSVPDLGEAVAEVRRVLKPGGRLLFIEHVRGSGRRAVWQDRLHPVWVWLAAGCHINRRTVEAIEAAGLEVEELEAFDPSRQLSAPGRWLGKIAVPFVQGVARRPS